MMPKSATTATTGTETDTGAPATNDGSELAHLH